MSKLKSLGLLRVVAKRSNGCPAGKVCEIV
jgi:hypothetical protein